MSPKIRENIGKLLIRALVICLIIAEPYTSYAINLIRDAEIENALKTYATPIFKTANLDITNLRFYIVNNPNINAFTVGGLNIFIHTGLIQKADNSNMLIGVIAHETGHIAGGHVIKKIGEIEDLSVQTILTTLLGAAVAVAGLPSVGIGGMMASQHVAERNYLSFSRAQEVAADAAAVRYLSKTHQSVSGLLKLFEILRRDQNLNYGTIDPYAVTHPLSEDRINNVRALNMQEGTAEPVDQYAEIHARMVAKLYGFLEKPDNTFYKYTDNSTAAIYARSIAYFQQSNFPKAFAEIDKLLAQNPNDPFFNELKGQFLAESGKPKEAIGYYQKADHLFPNSCLIKTELGKLLLDDGQFANAIDRLVQATKLEKTNSETWHLLATAYGKKGDEGMSQLMLAEESRVNGQNKDARNFARLARDKLPKNSSGWLEANDILADIKLDKNKDENRNEKDFN